MARGFASTLGVSDTTDGISTTYSTSLTTRTVAVFIKPRIAQPNFNAISDKLLNAADTDVEDFYFGAGGTTVKLDFFFSGGPGHWRIDAAPATGSWSHLAYSYDCSATANNPAMYLNGASQTVVRETGPIGTAKTNTSPYRIGGWAADSAASSFDGMLAEYAIWSVLLTQGEITALAAGISPMFIRPDALVEYVPMLNDNVSLRNAAPTITGTQVQPHPPMFYGGRKQGLTFVDGIGWTAFEGFQPNAFQAAGYQQKDIRTAFEGTAFQSNAFQIIFKPRTLGVLSATFADMLLAATAQVKVHAVSSMTLADMTLTSTAKVRVSAVLAKTFDDMTVVGTALVIGDTTVISGAARQQRRRIKTDELSILMQQRIADEDQIILTVIEAFLEQRTIERMAA